MNIKKYKLTNGSPVVLAPLKEVKTITLLVLFKVGSRYETKKINGTSHFIEHLFFKGTKKRPSPLLLSKELDGLGAEYNAFTTKDHTGYFIKINSEKIEPAMEIIADMLLNSLFDPKEIDRERKVILEEINMCEDNPLMYIEDLFEQTCFQDSPLGMIISGPKENICRLTSNDIINYKNQFYHSQNLLLGLAGNINENKLKNLINHYFLFPIKKFQDNNFIPFKQTQSQPRLTIKYKETEQVQIGLGFPALKNTDKDLMALYLLSIIIGGNMSSRLFTKIREEHGLAYYIKSSVNTYEDTGNLFIQAGLERLRLFKALTLIKNELQLVIKNGITKEELLRTKEFLKGRLILKLEESHLLIQWLAEQLLLTKKIETLEEKIKKINAVTLNDIFRVTKKVINFQKLNLAIIGPFKDKNYFNKII